MNLDNIKKLVVGGAGRGGLIFKKYSPELLMGVGVVGVLVSAVMACKSTLKIDDIKTESESKLEKIRYAHENLDKETYSDMDYKKDLALTYAQTGLDFVKLYGPALLVGAVSIGCILGSHGILKKRNLAVVAAYKAVEKSFSDYRKRVIDELGIDKDRLFKNGIVQSKIKVTEMDENGKVKKSEQTIETIDPNGISQYARFFDEGSQQWSKTPEYNFTFLKCQQNYANDLLHSRGHIFLNEVYDMLGIPRSQAGAVVGWVRGVGDAFVDFGMFNGESMAARDFVNGYERSILIDFNVAGVIYDMI